MTDEMGDTWRRTGTVDFSIKMITMTKHAKNKKRKGEHFEDIPFCFVLNQIRLIKKHQHGRKEAQMMTFEEAPGLLDRVRIEGRMTTARASDDGASQLFPFLSGVAEKKENQNILIGNREGIPFLSSIGNRDRQLETVDLSAGKVATRATGERKQNEKVKNFSAEKPCCVVRFKWYS